MLLAYLVSFLWLGGFIVCVPYVILAAPSGLVALFTHPPLASRGNGGPAEIWIHAVFWPLFLFGAFGCRKLPTAVATAIYAIIVIVLLLTLRGCAEYYDARGTTFN